MVPSRSRFLAFASAALLAVATSCSTEDAAGPEDQNDPPPTEDQNDQNDPPDPAASNAKLSDLAISAGTLSPAFDPDVTAYTVSLGNAVTTLSVTPSVSSGSPAITVTGPSLPAGGVLLAPGATTTPMTLSVGDNHIAVATVSEDATSSMTYDVTATRAAPPSVTCPTVQRGSPTDGVTTITVIQPPAPCNAGAKWAGWDCTMVESRANYNGVVYTIDVRWNRVGQAVRGTFTWITGNDSSTHWREGNNLSPSVQDTMDSVDQIRSVDLAWTGNGTAKVPRNGYPNLSSTYADVLEHLVATGVMEGVVGHFGNSGGSMMGMNALTHHDLDQVLDGIVVGGGPFWIDLEEICTDPTSPLFTGSGGAVIDDWNWLEWNGTTPCQQHVTADPTYGCRSTLGPDANSNFPNTIVSIMVGTQDRPFVNGNAFAFYNAITARAKTWDTPNTPHNVLKNQAGANLVLQRIREVVDAGPGH